MASFVYYKFKSQRDESRVTFDGTGISVFDLKKEIILANNLQKATDVDIALFDSSSDQEYKDDSHIIPRSSSVLAKRVAARPGKGKIPMYVAAAPPKGSEAPTKTNGAVSNYTWTRGTGSNSRRFDGKDVKEDTPPAKVKSAMPASSVTQGDEAAAMAAMFQAQTENWEETQEKMSHAVRIYNNPRGTSFNRGGGGGRPFTSHQAQSQPHHHQPDRPLPPSYVCYRCGQKGHWIQDCPTNNDREYDNRPRIKRTTGIPRSFLKAVEQPGDGQLAQGVMVTPDGGYVVAQPDLASWQKQVSRPKALTAADVRDRSPTDPSLICPIDNKLFRDAVKTPCCGTLYCEECIQTHLLERDFVCPHCGKKIPSLDKVVMDKPMRTKVADYIDKAIEESKKDDDDDALKATPGGNLDSAAVDASNNEQDYYSEFQPGGDIDMAQIIDSIPHLQAQIAQISVMLQNPSLPANVRQMTHMQHQELQMQLHQAQTFSALATAAGFQAPMAGPTGQTGQGFQSGDYRASWTNPFPNQQPASQDSAYQRLPVNNRRRNLKRDRPSDFLEMSGENGAKVPRYWE